MNYPTRLPPVLQKEVEKHAIRTIEILISKIIKGIEPDYGIDDYLRINRIDRGAINEIQSILLEVRNLIEVASAGLDAQKQIQDITGEALMLSVHIISKAGPKAEKMAENLEAEIQALICAVTSKDYPSVAQHRDTIEKIAVIIRREIMAPMQEAQAAIKEPIDDILTGKKYTGVKHATSKKLILMTYLAASHHFLPPRSKEGYPTPENMNGILPDYKSWFAGSGRLQAKLLSILDVVDALLSPRAYKDGIDPDEARNIIINNFLNEPGEVERFSAISDFIFDFWKKMAGAVEYNAKRKADYERKKKG